MSFHEHILSQPRRLRGLLEQLHRSDHPLRSASCARLLETPRLLLTGMGSSLFASYPAYLRLASAGARVSLWETAELLHFAAGAIDAETLLVAVSQSGETAEIKALLEMLPVSQPVIGVTNAAESFLGRRATLRLEMHADRGPYASTQTYVNSVALLLALAYLATEQRLDGFLAVAARAAGALEAALDDAFARTGAGIDPGGPLVFLARGPSLASARQAALMFQEVVAIPAAAMSAAAFRHGPLEMAGSSLRAVVLLPYGLTASLVENLAVEIERLGARVIRIADARLGGGDFRHPPVEEELAPLVNIAPAQALAYRTAVALGREPGVFRQAQSVTSRE